MYDIQVLPGPSNSDSEALGINSKGDVVGVVWPYDKQGHLYMSGALWSGGSLSSALAEGTESVLYGVNASQNAVGLRGFNNSPTEIAIVASGTAITDMSPPVAVGSVANQINDRGHACGWSWNDARSFIYDVATKSIVSWINPLPGAKDSAATAINELDQVAGLSDNTAFFYDAGAMKDLGPMPFVEDLNESGVVCGSVGKPYPANFRAAICDTKQATPTWTELPLPVGAIGSHGQGINDKGDVVGTYWTEQTYNGQQSAYVYTGGAIIDLNTQISEPGWHLEFADKINNAGQICGRGTYNGQSIAFLLTPQGQGGHGWLTLPLLVATLFGGVSRDGGGWGLVGGHPIHIDPWGPPTSWLTVPAAKRDALIALAIDEVAMFISDPKARQQVRRALIDAARTRLENLAQTAADGRAYGAVAQSARVARPMHAGKSVAAAARYRAPRKPVRS